ncbi:MAG: phage integrase N-terminal SAM-like domain-containing protein [Candidatus Thermoplasmatota archaeon]
MKSEVRIGESLDGRITVAFEYNLDYISKVKAINGYRWHPEDKYWSFPLDGNTLKKIVSLFEGEKVDIDSALHLAGLRKELTTRKYSPKTIKGYIHYNEDLLRFVNKNPAEVTNEDVGNCLYCLADRRKVSTSSLNVAINALKLY